MSRHRDTLASIILHTFVRKKIGEKKRNKFHRYLLLVEGTSRHPQLNHSFIYTPAERERESILSRDVSRKTGSCASHHISAVQNAKIDQCLSAKIVETTIFSIFSPRKALAPNFTVLKHYFKGAAVFLCMT